MSSFRLPPVTGSFVATGSSAAFAPSNVGDGPATMNLAVWGVFVGTVIVQKSFDGGTTWIQTTANGVATHSLTTPAAETDAEWESNVLWRMTCSAFTSGTINYRISQ